MDQRVYGQNWALLTAPSLPKKIDIVVRFSGGVCSWAAAKRAAEKYGKGFPHANCGGGCIKAGIAHFAHLLRTRPKTFDRWQREEEKLREQLGDVSILKDRRGGETKPLTLKALRARMCKDRQLTFDESLEWGGCGCAVE